MQLQPSDKLPTESAAASIQDDGAKCCVEQVVTALHGATKGLHELGCVFDSAPPHIHAALTLALAVEWF